MLPAGRFWMDRSTVATVGRSFTVSSAIRLASRTDVA
jgi:hypothetical protein